MYLFEIIFIYGCYVYVAIFGLRSIYFYFPFRYCFSPPVLRSTRSEISRRDIARLLSIPLKTLAPFTSHFEAHDLVVFVYLSRYTHINSMGNVSATTGARLH